MKFDLHCHTKAGSFDSKVELSDYISRLKECGFSGMMITDHTSYKGTKIWDEIKNQEKFKDFTVIKAVEYDTKDAGHILVILPDDILPKVLSIRGLPLEKLIKLVHGLGGILGPAHPFGAKSSSLMFSKVTKEKPHLLKKFDFLEGFNTCESNEANEKALNLANSLKIPATGGSDSHKINYVGMGYTEFSDKITSNNDIIKAISENSIMSIGGVTRIPTLGMFLKLHWTSVVSFKIYNLGLGYLYKPARRHAHKLICLQYLIK